MLRQHCTNFSDIAQEKSQVNIEQKDKIVWNNYISSRFLRNTIKPVTPEHRTQAEQRNTPEQWRNNGIPRSTSGTPRNINGTTTSHQRNTRNNETTQNKEIL